MPLQPVFPTPIFFGEIDNHTEVKEELDAVIKQIDFKYNESWGATHHLSDPTFKQNLIADYDLKHLKKAIQKNVFEYLGEVFQLKDGWKGQHDYNIMQSWIALFKKGNYGHIHSHGEADIAGVYYHTVPEGSGHLFFEPPAPQLSDSMVFSRWGTRMDARAPEGGILLFPGFMKHGIQTNTTDHDRISVSFNILFDRSTVYR